MKNLLFTLTLLTILFAGCKKNAPEEPEVQPVLGTVTIEQKIYNTMSIDGLEWTTDNYDGTIGVYYNNEVNSTYGKLLTLKQTKQVVLPAGWRVPSVTDYVKLIGRNGGFVKFNTNAIIDKNILDEELKPETVNSLLSTNLWSLKGSNKSLFNAVPAGYVHDTNIYVDKGHFAALWTTTVYQSGTTYQPVLLGLSSEGGIHSGHFAEFAQPISNVNDDTKGKGSVRFVRNIQ